MVISPLFVKNTMSDSESTKLLLLVVILIVIISVLAAINWRITRDSLKEKIKKHFGKEPKQLSNSIRSCQGVDFPNLHIAIKEWVEEKGGSFELVGHGGYGLKYLNQELPMPGAKISSLQHECIDTNVDTSIQCPRNGIYLIKANGKKYVAEASFLYEGSNVVELIVYSEDSESSSKFIEEVRELVSKHSIYKGKIISVTGQESLGDVPGWTKIQFHKFADITKEQIILPEKTMALIDRNIASFYKHSARLKKVGKSLKRGILFHGKPGTGKTFTAKFLSQYLEGVTVFLLSGEQLWLIKESFQMARLLAPSLVIMEDVDLIAHTRDETLGQTILHQLLNELDGLNKDTEILFLLTTNRPEVIEPALSLRPGRIDQAIEFPLPDQEDRRRLIEQYSEGMDLSVGDFDKVVKRSEGASPAFIQELMRKSALIAAESDPNGNGNLKITEEHIHQALDELLLNGPLTKKIVGFHQID